MTTHRALIVAVVVLRCTPAAAEAAVRPADVQRAREIFAELISIDTSEHGDTAKAARAMATRLIAAGIPEADVKVFEPAAKRGNLVARYRGNGRRRPVLLMAHLDTVAARKEEWSTDPLQLVEKNGYLYGRGAMDDKFMAAAFVAALLRFQAEGYKPDRDVILVLETDEELGDEHQRGITWLLANQRPLLDAELALNEGGWLGMHDGKPVANMIQLAERNYQSYFVEVTNRGGHAARPRKDNAIYELAAALSRIEALQFPIEVGETSRAYLEAVARREPEPLASDLRALLRPNPPAAAIERVRELPIYNGLLRTTCVATQLQAGDDEGELPTHARATITCLILPTHSSEEVLAALQKAAGMGAAVTLVRKESSAGPSTLPPDLLAGITALSKKHWPGVEVVPGMSLGSSDGLFLRNAGIPTFGQTGLAVDLVDWRMHGKDERITVGAFREGQQYLYELVKLIAGER